MKEKGLAKASVSIVLAAIMSVNTLTYVNAENEIMTPDTSAGESIIVCTKHTYDNGKVIKAATIKEKGEVKYTCIHCGEEKTVKTPALVSITKAEVSGIKERYKYTGTARKPKLILKYDGKTLKAGTDYKITYKNNLTPGKATAIVTGIGRFGGSFKKSFVIIPSDGIIKSAKASKANTVTVKFKALKKPSGYRVAYSTNKNFKSGTVKYKYVKADKTSVNITGLTGGKTYYFKVQGYKLVGGKKYFGVFSSVKKATVKKSAAELRKEKQEIVCDFANSNVGGAYIYGGASYRATDCSGLTMQCLAQIGVSLPHNAAAQANYGKAVSYSDMQPGDVIIMCYGGHAGIYVGNGRFVHATNEYRGIVSDPVSQLQYYHVDAIRRFI